MLGLACPVKERANTFDGLRARKQDRSDVIRRRLIGTEARWRPRKLASDHGVDRSIPAKSSEGSWRSAWLHEPLELVESLETGAHAGLKITVTYSTSAGFVLVANFMKLSKLRGPWAPGAGLAPAPSRPRPITKGAPNDA